MRLIIDIEANGLENPTEIWCIVCKDIDTGELYIFRKVTQDAREREAFHRLLHSCDCLVGHNILSYDLPVLTRLLDVDGRAWATKCVDTLICSLLFNFAGRGKHSVEAYGEEFGLPKGVMTDFSKYTQEMEDYCVRDVEITSRIYDLFVGSINDSVWSSAILLEHRFQSVVNNLHSNGFYFNRSGSLALLSRVERELAILDKEILKEFPPREVLIREFTPKATKHGTISRSSVPRSLLPDIHLYEVGTTYRHTKIVPFNPASHKQIIDVLHEAGWKPENKTKTHIELEREVHRQKYQRKPMTQVDLTTQSDKLRSLAKYGWKIDETNLDTLPPDAPSAARTLAKRILLESRRRTLTEWLGLVSPEGRIHGKFVGIGAWTHRMAHQNPNTANIPNEFDTQGLKKLYGKEMRALWQAPHNRLLVGVDAEGIQLRIFAHLIDDPEFTRSLVEGKKDDKSDPHSLNQRILGGVCKSRAAAKRFIYALLLGAGIGKLAEILGCSTAEAKAALDRLLVRYTGFARLKKEVLPQDGKRGYLIGLDGRRLAIPADTAGGRTHLAMSGYLQSGEAIVMKKACLLWQDMLHKDNVEYKLVNFVHDEWQTECANDMKIALHIAKTQADSLRMVGEELGLKCPLAGSYWNEDHRDYTIGTNWSVTH